LDENELLDIIEKAESVEEELAEEEQTQLFKSIILRKTYV